MFSTRAQGTIEYLIIISIIIVIALVVVGTLTTFTTTSQGTNQTLSKIKTQTGLIAVTETSTNPDGNYLIRLQSNDPDNITITNIKIGDTNNNYTEQLPQGSAQNFEIDTTDTCTQGENTTQNITITYITRYGITKTQTLQNVTFPCENYSVNTTATPTTTEEEEEETDTTPPTIFLLSPADDDINTNATVTFDFNVSDDTNANINQCSLYIDNVDVNDTPTFTDANNAYFDFNFAANGYSDQIYDWNVTCTDGTNIGSPDANRQLNLDLNSYELTYCKELKIGASAYHTELSSNPTGYFVLTEDINCYADTHEGGYYWNDGVGWEPIWGASDDFSGTFDGNGHVIYGLFTDSPDDYVGLFSSLIDGAIVKNLGLVDVNINLTTTNTAYVGGIAGYVHEGATIQDSYVTGYFRTAIGNENFMNTGGIAGMTAGTIGVSVQRSYFSGTIDAMCNAGGIAGRSGSDFGVLDCYSLGTINTSGSATCDGIGGGLIGLNYGYIQNSFSAMNITSDYAAGGLVGASAGCGAYDGAVDYSFATGSINAPLAYWIEGSGLFGGHICETGTYAYDQPGDDATSCGGNDDCTEQDISLFKGTSIATNEPFATGNWDFDTIWTMVDNNYPKLAWEN